MGSDVPAPLSIPGYPFWIQLRSGVPAPLSIPGYPYRIQFIPAAIVSFCFHFCSFENHAERPYKLWIMDVVGLIRVDLFLFVFSHLNVWILFGKLSVFPCFFFGGLVDVFSVVVFLGFFIWGRGEQSLTSFDPLRGVCVCVCKPLKHRDWNTHAHISIHSRGPRLHSSVRGQRSY